MGKFEALLIIPLNWFIPGSGFMIKGMLKKGLILFLIINVTFLIGLLLHGAVVIPTFDRRAEAFNWVNILTFLGQLGNGGLSLFSIMHEKIRLGWFKYYDYHPWSDLASLYFLVSGALNYFSTCNLYDRLYAAATAEKGNSRA